MRVLVTGAAGFLGRHLVARLLARGDAVVGLDLGLDPPLPGGAEAVAGSVTDAQAVRRAAEGCEAVIHTAAITGLWARDPSDFERVNLGGTRTVLAAAAQAGARRAVHVSSYTTLIAGRRGDPARVLDEREELPPEAMLGPYPRAKRLAELAAAEAPFPAAIVLPSAPVGPGDHRPTPPGALLRDLANARLPAMIDCSWNLVDVRALADGVLAALERGAPGRRYLLAGEDMDTDGLVARFERVSGARGPRARAPYGVALAAAHVEERLARLTARPPRAPVTGVRIAGPRLGFDISRARAELGFDPPPAEAAIRDALLWMRERGWIERELPGLDRG
jgi:dihydroflavonol-4-reductase